MRSNIHPVSQAIQARCSCGHVFELVSARKTDIRLDVCNLCHPFFTGKQRIVDTEGRVDRFKKRFGDITSFS